MAKPSTSRRRRRRPPRQPGVRTNAKKSDRDPDPGAEQAKAVGQTLRYEREDLGLTLEEIEAEIGISASYLSKIERGLLLPPTSTLQDIAEFLGLAKQRIAQLIRKADVARDCTDLVRMGYGGRLALLTAALHRAPDRAVKEALDAVEDDVIDALGPSATDLSLISP